MPKKQSTTRIVHIDADKHRALKRYAKDRGMLLGAVMDEAITSYITRKRIDTEAAGVAA